MSATLSANHNIFALGTPQAPYKPDKPESTDRPAPNAFADILARSIQGKEGRKAESPQDQQNQAQLQKNRNTDTGTEPKRLAAQDEDSARKSESAVLQTASQKKASATIALVEANKKPQSPASEDELDLKSQRIFGMDLQALLALLASRLGVDKSDPGLKSAVKAMLDGQAEGEAPVQNMVTARQLPGSKNLQQILAQQSQQESLEALVDAVRKALASGGQTQPAAQQLQPNEQTQPDASMAKATEPKDKMPLADDKANHTVIAATAAQDSTAANASPARVDAGQKEMLIQVSLNHAPPEPHNRGSNTFDIPIPQAARELAQKLGQTTNHAIADAAKIILKNNEEGIIRLRLNPPSLGDIKIELKLTEKNISGQIIVQSDEMKAVFDKNLQALSDAFAQSGFSSTKLDVTTYSGQEGQHRDATKNVPWWSERLAPVAFEDEGVPRQFGRGQGSAVNLLV